jgi:adenylate cyclase class IV
MNLEVRFRLDDATRVERQLRSIAAAPTAVEQEDTFFAVPKGRLLLRREPGHAELIFYSRRDLPIARPAAYFRHGVTDAESAEARLGRQFGVSQRVRKQRLSFDVGRAQVCLDAVSELGDFVDVRVPMRGEEDLPTAHAVVNRIVAELGLDDKERVPGDYDDLLKVKERGGFSIPPRA